MGGISGRGETPDFVFIGLWVIVGHCVVRCRSVVSWRVPASQAARSRLSGSLWHKCVRTPICRDALPAVRIQPLHPSRLTPRESIYRETGSGCVPEVTGLPG